MVSATEVNWWATYALDLPCSATEREGLDGLAREVGSRGRDDDRRPHRGAIHYSAQARNRIRAFMADVRTWTQRKLIDVRSPDEFSGRSCTCPTIRRGRDARQPHQAPRASVGAPQADGTFKSADELRAIYQGETGSLPKTTSSRIYRTANARCIFHCSPTYSATTRFGTTTVAGPRGNRARARSSDEPNAHAYLRCTHSEAAVARDRNVVG